MQHAPTVSIRKAGPADVPGMIEADVCAQAQASRRAFLEAVTALGECFVAIDERCDVLGFVVLSHGFFEQGFVPLLVVSPMHRRAGLGLRLLAAAESACQTAKLFSSTNMSNSKRGPKALLTPSRA